MNMEKITIDEAINKWFEMKYQAYDKLEHDDSIYLYNKGEEFAEIRIAKKTKYIDCRTDLWDEFFVIFPIENSDFLRLIRDFIEYTFGLTGFTPHTAWTGPRSSLKIPNIKK